jgi:hypothetical protein
MSAQIGYQENNLVLTIPKAMMDDRLMRRLVEWVEFLNLSEQNRMSADDAWALSEEAKEKWWAENGEKLLAKLGLQ